jgi:two-component system sensor histidine kinase KdpD
LIPKRSSVENAQPPPVETRRWTIIPIMARRRSSDAISFGVGIAAVAGMTFAYARLLPESNAATISTTFLMVVLVVASISRLWVAIATSVFAMLCFNFFFLPPAGALSVADPQNWVALLAFLTVSLVASNLSAVARARTEEAVGRRDELARLFDLSRDVLVITDSREATSVLARAIARRFDLEFVAIALPNGSDWEVHEAGVVTITMDRRQLTTAFAAAQTLLEFDAYARTYAGHRTMEAAGRTVRLVPLRVGTRPVGLLASSGRPIEAGTLDALAGVVAIAIERNQFLEDRKSAELMRQSEELKTALLASLGHDLRTPLTTIRVAATNIQSPLLSADDRFEQSDLILGEVERLTRLFQNILEMARIDAGGISTESRWVHPSEIVAAARDRVEHTLGQNRIEVTVEPDVPVRLDPRLAAAALAHLLENAAQYAPANSTIAVTASLNDEGLLIKVRDHGPGIAPADLPHLFERFYRGDAARVRASGTGMGLWIARELLAVEHGRLWAENAPDGGALFTLVIPASRKGSSSIGSPAA